jgi:hypothetical protein
MDHMTTFTGEHTVTCRLRLEGKLWGDANKSEYRRESDRIAWARPVVKIMMPGEGEHSMSSWNRDAIHFVSSR